MANENIKTGTFRKVQVGIAVIDFIHRLNPGEEIEKVTEEEIALVRNAVGQVLANHGIDLNAYYEGLVLPSPAKTVLTFRFGDGGLKVGLFDTEEQAEVQAIEWVNEAVDGTYDVTDMDDVRDLECENGSNIAVDIAELLPGEVWGND